MRSSNLFPALPALTALLLAAAAAAAAPQTVSGTVVDAETGEPLAGANLTTKNLAVTTDGEGRFELPLAAGDSAAVSHVGYEPAVIRARPGVSPKSMILSGPPGVIRARPEAPGPLTVRLRPVVLPVPETVVTGGLTEQALGEVSSAVTVFDRGRIDAGGGHLQELIPAVPNLNWAGGTSRPRYFQIRGMGERSHYPGEGPPSFSVGFVMDDVDLSGLGMAGMLHDLDQAEVFKGPQSTIFGPNAMAGLINLKSADPTGSMSLGGTVSAGSDGLLRISPTLNLPAGEQLALRVGGSWGRSNGFRENRHLGVDDSNGRNETLARAKLRYGNGAGARLVATFFRADLDNGYDAWVPDNNEDLVTYSDNPGVDSQTTHAASLRASLPLAASGAELVSITSWGRTELEHSYDGDWGNDEFWKQEPYGFDPEEQGWSYDFFDRNLRDRTTFTQEVRLLKEDRGGSGDLVAGAYLKSLRENDDAGGYLFGGDATDLQSRFDIADLAFYGQYGRELSPRWRLTLDARVDRNATSYEGTTNSGAEQVEFEVTQWLPGGKLALTHALAPDRNLYAAVSRGFRAGGVNQHPRLAPASRPFDPEYVLNWEVGYRASGTRATTALTFFHALRSDQQVELSSQQDPGDPNSFFYFTANAVSGRNSGLEVEHSLRVTPWLRLTGSLGLLDTQVDEYTFPTEDGEVTLGDRAAAHAPTRTWRIGGDYRHRSGLTGRLALSGMSEFFFSDSHDQKSEPYQLLSGSLEYASGSWSLLLWGRNVLDRRYAVRGFFFGLEPPAYEDTLYLSYGDPMQFGVTLKTSVIE